MILYAVRRIADGSLFMLGKDNPIPLLFATRAEARDHIGSDVLFDPSSYEIVSADCNFQTKGERRMATPDVPGSNPANKDVLAMGCWAEHQDGSLLFVESTEAGRVIYSMFDVSKDPILEYRDSMPEVSFKSTYTWEPDSKRAAKKSTNEKWTWHDKTAFPWDRIIKRGFTDGVRHASADGVRTAAERVAESLRLRARQISGDEYAHRSDRSEVGGPASVIWGKIRRAIDSAVKEFDR